MQTILIIKYIINCDKNTKLFLWFIYVKTNNKLLQYFDKL